MLKKFFSTHKKFFPRIPSFKLSTQTETKNVFQQQKSIKPDRDSGPWRSSLSLLFNASGIAEVTSTLLRDKLGLDKESGRDQVRRLMRKLEKAGKVVIEKKGVKEKGARKQYVYRLVE